MKLDRMLGIITILLQHEKMTAPELAEKMEVSRRTIHRDIDAICQAGIPVVTCQGGGGGISIAKGYKLDKSVLTHEELEAILTGLKSLNSVSNASSLERLISRLSPEGCLPGFVKENVMVDLSSHYKSSLSTKIGMIKAAINDSRLISFNYFSEKGKTSRVIEPANLTFQWSAWYVFGFCRGSGDFRLFKLNRLWELQVLGETFTPRAHPADQSRLDSYFSDLQKVTLLLDRELEYLIVEEYGPESYEVLDDGRIRTTLSFTRRDYMIGWILSMGEKALVLEPPDMADEVRKRAKNIVARYEHDA